MKDYIKNRLYEDKKVFKIDGDFLELNIYRLEDEDGKIVAFKPENKDIDLNDLDRLSRCGFLYSDIFKQIYEQKELINKIIDNKMEFDYLKDLILQKNITAENYKKVMFLKNYINNFKDKVEKDYFIGLDYCDDFFDYKMSNENKDDIIKMCSENAEVSKISLNKKIIKEEAKQTELSKNYEELSTIKRNYSRRIHL